MADIAVEFLGEAFKVAFLALFAGHAIGLAVDRHHYLRHGTLLSDSYSAIQDRADGFHRRHEAARDFAIDFLEPVGAEL